MDAMQVHCPFAVSVMLGGRGFVRRANSRGASSLEAEPFEPLSKERGECKSLQKAGAGQGWLGWHRGR